MVTIDPESTMTKRAAQLHAAPIFQFDHHAAVPGAYTLQVDP